ncbi:MAG: hypothetical protein MI919_11875 [Holophagales bacterium]|nr:hypothetical protein [Holophagales bacterium]
MLEVLVALAVLGLALVSTLTLLSGHAALDRRLDGHLKVIATLEAEHELIRSGAALPLIPGEHPISPVAPPGDPVRDFRLWVRVKQRNPTGLYEVTLFCRYSIDRGTYERELELRLWRPPLI